MKKKNSKEKYILQNVIYFTDYEKRLINILLVLFVNS